MGYMKAACLAVVPVLLACYIYRVHVPYPDHVHTRWLKSAIAVLRRALQNAGDGLEKLGIVDNISVTRWAISLIDLLNFGPNMDTTKEMRTIDGVEVWIFRPGHVGTSKLLPAVVYLHGGGFVYRGSGMTESTTRIISNVTQAVVVSVKYRLAPEIVYPAPYEDCLAVTKYVLTSGQELGIDSNRVAIAGDSAGGNLAMAVALTLAAETGSTLPKLKVLGLVSSFLQGFNFNLPSYLKYASGPGLLTKKDLLDFWSYYVFGSRSLAEEFSVNNHTSSFMKETYSVYVSENILPAKFRIQQENTKENKEGNHLLINTLDYDILLDYRLNPLMSPDDKLLGLPRTYIYVAEFDPLRDDGLILAERLRRLGHPVELCYDEHDDHTVFYLPHLTKNSYDQVEKFALYLHRYL